MQSHTRSPLSFSSRKLKRLASPHGPSIIFNEITKQKHEPIDTYAENGIASLYERIHIATGSAVGEYREEEEDQSYKLKGRDNERYFEHKLDRLKERLKCRPLPTIKQNISRDPLFLDYTLRLRHLDSNYLKVLMVARNKKVEKLRQKHNSILLRQIFNYWNRQKNVANKVKLFLSKRKEVFAHEAFYAWVKYKKRAQRERRYTFAILRTKSKKYKFHKETHLKISLFNALIKNVNYVKRQYIKAERFYTEKVAKTKRQIAFRKLKKYVSIKKRKRILKKKIIWFRNQSLKYKMHVAWLNFLYQRKFLRYYLNKLVLRFKHKELFSGLDAWKEYTDWHRTYGDFIFRFPHIEEKENMEDYPHSLCYCIPLILRRIYNDRYRISHHDQIKDMFRLLLVMLIIVGIINIANGSWSTSNSYVNIYILFLIVLLLVSVGAYIIARKFHVELNCIREGHSFQHQDNDDKKSMEDNARQFDPFGRVC